ncbi:DNA adenine methylase [Mycobacterium sp. E2327]|uniref:DNA adenine methylase n=1 Tax=Mycobacterium sp. E2327 TaxID=1834132 RepID=UPI000B22D37F|nr:DNA adenine methylase [Mycobacterium sp. E2327]
MSVRYIGSKARVAQAIVELAGEPAGGRFIDAFCGTGSVAAAAADQGWAVTLNDFMPSAIAMATGAIAGTYNAPFTKLGGYERACHLLNEVAGEAGFIYEEYSPASARRAGIERRYFTEANAMRLDAMRKRVALWSRRQLVTETEEQLLLADLIRAANRVANISGTYGCFLSSWTDGALRSIAVHPRRLPRRRTIFAAKTGDVFDVSTKEEDVVYYDPPYTKRQYAAYYHVLETLTVGDRPKVEGVTGLRPWRDRASDFCYKARALNALRSLILGTQARKILLSYSNEGHVERDELVAALTEAGEVFVHEIRTIGRYRPNAVAASARAAVDEYVIEVRPATARNRNRLLDQVGTAVA